MPYPKRYVGKEYPLFTLTLQGHRAGSPSAPIVLEVFLDFVCPFSKKAYNRLKEVRKHFGEDKLQFVMHNWIQPWHPQSYYLVQAVITVEVLNPDKYWDMVDLIYENQEKVFEDAPTANLTKNDIYAKLAELAESLGVNKDNFLELVNSDGICQQVKFYQKYGRQNSIHSSPTFMVNGIIVQEASSSWDLDKWKEFITPLLE